MSQNQPEIQYAAFLAIDWADQKHVWSLQDANSSTCERGEVDHMPEAVEAWAAQMSQRFAGRPIAVAVEQSRGALVFLLSKYEQLHIEGLACVVFAGGVRCPDNPGQQKDHSNLYTALGKVSLELLFRRSFAFYNPKNAVHAW